MPGRRQVRLGRCVMAPLAQFRLRSRLAAAARQYIAADWPVASGAWWDAAEQRYRCDQAECVTQGLHPTLPGAASILRRCQVSVAEAATPDLASVAGRWSQRPYSLLLPTGHSCDVLELGVATVRRVRAYLDAGPAATLPDGRVLLFTTVAAAHDDDLGAELSRVGALHHSHGSWVPLPPSQLATGPVRWSRSPGAAGWRLPSPYQVAHALRAALSAVAPAEGR